MQYLEFGNSHIEKKKNKKKKKIITCKFDQEKLKEDEILIHFMEMHQKEHDEWVKNGKKPFEFKTEDKGLEKEEAN